MNVYSDTHAQTLGTQSKLSDSTEQAQHGTRVTYQSAEKAHIFTHTNTPAHQHVM